MDDTSSFLQPIVVDSGSGLIKAGFSGSDKPKCVYRSYVGRAKHKRTLIAEDRDLYAKFYRICLNVYVPVPISPYIYFNERTKTDTILVLLYIFSTSLPTS